jgi:DNA-binding protein Fis
VDPITKTKAHSGARNDQSFRSLSENNAEYFERLMQYTEGNKSRASRVAGIDPKTLRSKLKEYGIG